MPTDRILRHERTCTNCEKSETCWAFHEMKKITDAWPNAGFVGAGAPGWVGDIFIAFANSCLLFVFKKMNKPNV